MQAGKIIRVVAVIGACAIGGWAQDGPSLKKTNRLLEAELSLAKAPGTYMVIDIEGRTVSLKARGIVLRQWPIKKTRSWGKAVPLAVMKLEGKSALSEPERPNITPGKEDKKSEAEGAKDPVDLGVLELKDMPVHFSLDFGKGIRVSVRPRTGRFWPVLVNIAKRISWHTYLPLKTIWFALRKKSFMEIELVMPTEKDAQGIYWSFTYGQNAIILHRRS
jgi:hypothetical protein